MSYETTPLYRALPTHYDSTPNDDNDGIGDSSDDYLKNDADRSSDFTSATSSSGNSSSAESDALEIDIDDAIDMIGMGRFQFEVLLSAGLCFASDAIEIMLLSFLTVVLTAEWNLTEREMDTVVSVVFAGAMMGTFVLGTLADRIGRRPVYLATAIIVAVFGILSAFVNGIGWFYVARFMVGFGTGGATVPFDIFAEFIPTTNRGMNLLYIELFWALGSLLTPLIAMWTLGDGEADGGSWRLLVICCAAPCVVSMILGFWFVPESPRWLLTQGRHEEALIVLRHAADKNGKDGKTMFPDDVVITHDDEEESTDDDSCLKLLSPKWFKLTMPLYSVWFGFGFLYYGGILLISLEFSDIQEVLQSSSADDSHGFDYNALFISGSAELFGLVVSTLIIDKLGRVATQFSAYFLGGTACLLLGCLSGSASRTTTVALAFVVRFFMISGSCSTWVATSELLPTDIRTTGHSAANAAGRMGGFAAPYLITPGIAPSSIGMLMMGMSLFTCLMCTLLPETSGKALGEATTTNTVVVEDSRSTRRGGGALDDLAKASGGNSDL